MTGIILHRSDSGSNRRTGLHSYSQPCRFLTKAVQKTMESVTLDQAEGADGADSTTPRASIAKRMRDRWA